MMRVGLFSLLIGTETPNYQFDTNHIPVSSAYWQSSD
jgi:hypothetical protein